MHQRSLVGRCSTEFSRAGFAQSLSCMVSTTSFFLSRYWRPAQKVAFQGHTTVLASSVVGMACYPLLLTPPGVWSNGPCSSQSFFVRCPCKILLLFSGYCASTAKVWVPVFRWLFPQSGWKERQLRGKVCRGRCNEQERQSASRWRESHQHVRWPFRRVQPLPRPGLRRVLAAGGTGSGSPYQRGAGSGKLEGV